MADHDSDKKNGTTQDEPAEGDRQRSPAYPSISLEEAMGRSSDQDELRNMLEGKGGMTIVDPSLRPRA